MIPCNVEGRGGHLIRPTRISWVPTDTIAVAVRGSLSLMVSRVMLWKSRVLGVSRYEKG